MNTHPDEDWFDPETTTFGDRLSGAREESGMSQEELAKRLGVKLKTLKSWEEDLSEPRANKLSMMAGMLNVSLSWLLTGEGEGPDGPDAMAPAADMPALLEELRDLHALVANAAERLGVLERQLQHSAKAGGDE